MGEWAGGCARASKGSPITGKRERQKGCPTRLVHCLSPLFHVPPLCRLVPPGICVQLLRTPDSPRATKERLITREKRENKPIAINDYQKRPTHTHTSLSLSSSLSLPWSSPLHTLGFPGRVMVLPLPDTRGGHQDPHSSLMQVVLPRAPHRGLTAGADSWVLPLPQLYPWPGLHIFLLNLARLIYACHRGVLATASRIVFPPSTKSSNPL